MKLITNYKGVGILCSKGHFYPSVDMDVCGNSVDSIVHWIEDVFLKPRVYNRRCHSQNIQIDDTIISLFKLESHIN